MLRRVGAVAVIAGSGAGARAVEQAEVDFADTGAAMTHRGSGFLLSIPASDALVAPVKPQMLRMRPTAVQAIDARAQALGVQRMQILVSDEFDNDYTSFPGDGGNWAPWENYVTGVATQAANNAVPVQFDIWNEPDLTDFWPRSQAQFLEAWRRAVVAIRAVSPNAQIVGPSFSNYSNTKIGMQNFLLYAKNNNVLPDVVSWHEYTTGFTARVNSTRNFMAANGISPRPISINEIVGQSNYASEKLWQGAGPLPQYFSEIERADIQSVSHACWNEPNTNPVVNNGENESLDGLLTPTTKQPRSTWWVYEKYGEMGGTVSGFDAGVVKNSKGITTFDGLSTKEDGVAHVLFGRFVASTSQLDASPVQVKLLNMDLVTDLVPGGNGQVRVIGEQIPDSGVNASSGPVVRMNQIFTVSNGQLVVPVNSFGRTDAYFLTIAAIGTWVRDADGVWSDTTAWSDKTVPDGVGAVARFGAAATAHRTVTVDAPRTVGHLTFDNPVGYRIAGGSPLTFDDGPTQATIQVLQGPNEIDAPVRASASGKAPDLAVSDGAKLTIGNASGIRLAHITLNTTGTLDTGGNDLVLDPNSGLSQAMLVRTLLQQAYNNGQWDGAGGLRSSGVAANSGTSLGYAEAGTLGISTFQGQPIDPLAVLVRQTFPGDANLDGRLNGDDFALLDRGFAKHLTGWVNGDFNYDDVIDAADYQVLNAAFGQQGMGGMAGLAAIVPEPPIVVLGLLTGILLRRHSGWRGRNKPVGSRTHVQSVT